MTLLTLGMAMMVKMPHAAATCLYWLLWGVFMLNACLRLTAASLPCKTPETTQTNDAPAKDLPVYSVIIALYREAGLVVQLTEAIDRMVYPRHKLEVLFALEDDDSETLITFEDHLSQHPHLSYMRVVRVPAGFPRTKPRALNYALNRAHGDLIVIYDAEDIPHPRQLLEAAHRFAHSSSQLACLQAPLRPSPGSSLIAHQFTLEYAAQFDVLLPAYRWLGLPFPLGGTSNHFKAAALKAAGGWDAHNVTEDADLGFRLARHGYEMDLIHLPTFETPPDTLKSWLPQRSRWIKGYIQTLLVHSRTPKRLSVGITAALLLSLGLGTLSAICYAPFMALLLARSVLSLLQPGAILMNWPDLLLLCLSLTAAQFSLTVGAQRAGLSLSLNARFMAPLYWALQSLAAIFACHQLLVKPFHWDKTDHSPMVAPPHE